jgi:tetratricopeptide (TPR) repeat protein
MKLKSVLASISISLLGLVLVIAFSCPTAAQSTDKKQILSKMLAVTNAGNPQIKPGKIDESATKTPALNASVAVEKKTTTPRDSDYWFAKGALCATYGNDRAAVKYFQKAISIDLNRSDAYFEQGISYGQLGDFDKAVTLVNQAIEMEPQNGLYLYGRGRIYLLSGKQEKAMEDIKKAAELDDEDAQTYLKYIALQ